ncbi:MAG TPA: MFS transporter, partial [Reyranellaceae bacterium]|nr:MFS transporter [Reyranellaceae bacterium]
VLLCFCFAFALTMLYRAANGLMAPELMAELDIAPARMGFVGGVYFLVFALAMIPGGAALDRFGPRLTISVMSLVGAVGCIVFAMSDDWIGLSAGRALLSLGCVGTLMGSIATLARWVPAERVTFYVAMVSAAGGVGSMLATTPLAWLIDGLGWRGAYWVFAASCLVVALVMWLGTTDRPDGKPIDSAHESLGDVLAGLRDVMRFPYLWPFVAMQLMVYPAQATLIALWGGPYLNDVHGLGLNERSWVLLAMTAVSVPLSFVIGSLDRRFNSRKYVVLALVLVMAATLAPLALWSGWPLWAATLLLCAFAATGSVIAVLHTHVRFSFPERLSGRALATLNTAVMVGAYVMQQATGFLVELIGGPAGYQAVFGWIILSLLVGAWFYRAVPDAPPRSNGPRG